MNIIDSNHLELRGKSEIAKHFKGHVQLDLCDPLTGRVKERVEGENTFTNALDSLINDSPFGLGKGIFNNTSVNGSGDINVTPINDIALGGCLLFRSFTNPDDLNDFYEPMSNQPTAYASKLNLSDDIGVDVKLGEFNSIESGEVENGFRNVYDWSTSAGNGTIGAIALTSRRGGTRYFSDYSYMRMISGQGYTRNILASTEQNIIAIGNGGIFTIDQRDKHNVYFYKQSDSKILLLENWNSSTLDAPTWSKSFDTTVEPTPVYCEAENKLYIFYTSGGENSVINAIIVDCADWSETTASYNTSVNVVPTSTSWNSWAGYYFTPVYKGITYLNGYIYALSSDKTKVYKIDASNPANVIEIPSNLNTGASNSLDMHTDGVYIYMFWSTDSRYSGRPTNVYIIGDDDICREYSSSEQILRLSRRGVYSIGASYNTKMRDSYVPSIGMTAYSSYLATKYSLEQAVTKTADKTMKLSYTVIQV